MPMNSSLTSSLSEFSKGRPDKPLRRSTVRNLITAARLWLGKLVSFAVVRVLLIFFVGFAAGIAWQSYGGAGRKAIAAWSPHLAWLAPAADGTSADRFKAMSVALTTARQNLDKLATEIGKIQAQDRDVPRRRAAR
jgi:hypothetical protein